jgi:ankyrin repeat protein
MVGHPHMKRALVLALWLSGAAFAQDGDEALRRGAGAVAAVGGEIGGGPVLGAGILFAREKDRLYIATAYHVVRKGQLGATGIVVKLRNWPGKSLPARLLPQMDRELDLAVLAVDNPAASGVDICALPLDVLAPPGTAKRGVRVYPVGNPNGEAWGVPVVPDAIMDTIEDRIVFQSAMIAPGHSGGALIDAGGRIVGMIQSDQPPNGRALTVQRIIDSFAKWQLPVHLRVPAKENVLPLLGLAMDEQSDLNDMKQLLAQPCTDVNARYPESTFPTRETALHRGAQRSGGEMVKLLLDAGAEVNALDGEGDPPLEYAASARNLAAAKTLVARGADVNLAKGYWTPLVRAISRGDLAMVQFLLASGANPNLHCPVMDAVHTNSGRPPVYDRILTALIAAGGDVNCKEKDGDSPLTMAVEKKQPEAVRLLLEANASVNVRNRNGDAPMHMVSNQYDSEETQSHQIAAGLLQHGATLDAVDEAPLLEKCARLGWTDVGAALVKRGVSLKGDAGGEALRQAAEYGQVEIARIFLQAGANASAGDDRTPLQYALGAYEKRTVDPARRFEMVQLLVSSGAKVNLRIPASGYVYQQPLYLSLITLSPPDLKIARFLIAHGAAITPNLLSAAKSQGSAEVVALLEGSEAQRKTRK